jgi:hypothetical protein
MRLRPEEIFMNGPEIAPSTGTGLSLLHRRDFLAYSSLLALAAWLPEMASAQSLESETAGSIVQPLSVGYLEGSDQYAKVRRLPGRVRFPGSRENQAESGDALQIVPANLLPLGDTSIVGTPLRMTIHGLYPPASQLEQRRRELPMAVDLDVLFPSSDPLHPQPNRFKAWSLRRVPGWDPSPPVSFVFPLGWQELPVISMRVVPNKGVPLSFMTGFTLDDESGVPKLRRGLYLLGLAPHAWDGTRLLGDLGRRAPASTFSVLVGFEPEPLPQ